MRRASSWTGTHFSAVLGTTSAKSSKTTLEKEAGGVSEETRRAQRGKAHLPTAWPSTLKSKNTRGFTMLSKSGCGRGRERRQPKQDFWAGRCSPSCPRLCFDSHEWARTALRTVEQTTTLAEEAVAEPELVRRLLGQRITTMVRLPRALPPDSANPIGVTVLGIDAESTSDEIKKACVPHELPSSSPRAPQLIFCPPLVWRQVPQSCLAASPGQEPERYRRIHETVRKDSAGVRGELDVTR